MSAPALLHFGDNTTLLDLFACRSRRSDICFLEEAAIEYAGRKSANASPDGPAFTRWLPARYAEDLNKARIGLITVVSSAQARTDGDDTLAAASLAADLLHGTATAAARPVLIMLSPGLSGLHTAVPGQHTDRRRLHPPSIKQPLRGPGPQSPAGNPADPADPEPLLRRFCYQVRTGVEGRSTAG